MSDQLADITINPAGALDLLATVAGTEVQEVNFDRNLQNIVVNRIQSQTAVNDAIGLMVGVEAIKKNAMGGNGDDTILDAALGAAGTMGVDSAETIYGVASEVEDAF